MQSQSVRLFSLFEGGRGRNFRLLMGGFAAIVTLMFGVLVFFVVPAPNNQTAMEITGALVSMSQPHPEHGDITIILDNGKRYYINRANEVAHLDWEAMLAEVQPGDEVTLTVVTPLAWRLVSDEAKTIQPIAGLRTADKIYLDSEITATTWNSQEKFSMIAIFSLIALIVCLLPDFFRVFNRYTPIST